MRIRSIIPFFLVLSLAVSAALAASVSPSERVRAATDLVLSILRDPGIPREKKWAQVSKVIAKGFDFESMSRSVLAANWRKATQEERRKFVRFFTQYLKEVYRTKVESYSDQEIRIDRERLQGNRASVETVIVSGKTEIPIVYKMRNVDDDWLVYDVVIEGVSLVSNYRNTFNAIAQTGGMQGLLSDVQRRIAKYKKQRAVAN